MATGEAIPLRGLEGVPGLPGAPQDEAGLTRKFETLGGTRRVGGLFPSICWLRAWNFSGALEDSSSLGCPRLLHHVPSFAQKCRYLKFWGRRLDEPPHRKQMDTWYQNTWEPVTSSPEEHVSPGHKS